MGDKVNKQKYKRKEHIHEDKTNKISWIQNQQDKQLMDLTVGERRAFDQEELLDHFYHYFPRDRQIAF